ncbi:hypothetical protein [Humibacter sp. RRB41]|uniref:hypothetical protein n=1 Tax=Humibacter sp. RRB41 TaxID=2919946 RepID=UPI001FA94C34|nr:hypothetical protein [Humibacter sp. RRB41]
MPRESHDDDLTAPAEVTAREELVEAQDAGLQDASAPAAAEADSGAGDEASVGEPIREEVAVESEHEVRVRRTPRYGRFMILGGVVFAVASFIVTYSLPQGTGYDRNTVFGFVLVGSVAVGVGLGALAAIIAAAATKHTERTVLADRIDVRQVDVGTSADELPDLGELPAKTDNSEPTAPAKRDAE